MKKKTIGIVLLVLGIMAVLGSLVNGSFASYTQGIALSDIVTIVLMFGMIVAGIILIVKSENN